MTHHWILAEDGKTPVPAETLQWARWFEGKKRILASDYIGEIHVSTVFLGIDHGFTGGGPPVLWETMIFGHSKNKEYQWRYCTYDDAKRGHENALKLATKLSKSFAPRFIDWLKDLV